jgi:hypothetical protein
MSTNPSWAGSVRDLKATPLKVFRKSLRFLHVHPFIFPRECHGAKASTSHTGYGFRGSDSDGSKYA